MAEKKKIIIAGSGPAGLAAAIYTARADLQPLLLAGNTPGGQLMLTSEVENYPGFIEGIQGPELMMNMIEQAKRFGAEFVQKDVTRVDLSKQPFQVYTDDASYETDVLILATGASSKWLGVPGEQEFVGKGVSTCATCDAPFFRDKEVIVVGGGDSAMEEALVLAKFASKVTIVVRKDSLRASKIMQQRARENERIQFLMQTCVREIKGEQFVESVTLENLQTQEKREFPTSAVFLAIGHIPNTQFLEGQIELNENGFIVTRDHVFTNIEGVFVGGDVEDFRYRQAVTAAGFGVMAALEAERFLEGTRL